MPKANRKAYSVGKRELTMQEKFAGKQRRITKAEARAEAFWERWHQVTYPFTHPDFRSELFALARHGRD